MGLEMQKDGLAQNESPALADPASFIPRMATSLAHLYI